MKYLTVQALFADRCPEIIGFLGNPGAFWTRVVDNTIPNAELVRDIRTILALGNYAGSAVFRAAVEVLAARSIGELPNPEN